MTVKMVTDLPAMLADEAWAVYYAAFRELNALAVQRHLMYRSEFDEVMNDRRVRKYLAVDDDGTLAGLSTFTDHLDAVPLISPQYFERRWPRHYAEHRIWYIGFVAVKPTRWGSRAFGELVEAMRQVAAPQAGIVGIDVCMHNASGKTHRHLPEAVRRMVAGPSPGVRMSCADTQSYWMYTFPDGTGEPSMP